jgi:hypothetical protein
MYQAILLDLLTRSIAEITKINADLAVTQQSYAASASMADEITTGVKRQESHHIEFSAFTGRQGRV